MNSRKFLACIELFKKDKNSLWIRFGKSIGDMLLVFGACSFSFFKISVLWDLSSLKNFFLVEFTVVCFSISLLIEIFILCVLLQHVYVNFFLPEDLFLRQKFILIKICFIDFIIYVLKRFISILCMIYFFNVIYKT